MHLHAVPVTPWNMEFLLFMATGMNWSVNSAKSDEKHSTNSPQQVVPSRQIAKFPSARSLWMLVASCSLLCVSATVLIGDTVSENLEME